LLTKNLEKIDHIHAHFADTQILYAKSFATWLGVDFSFTVHGYDLREFPIGKENLLRTAASAKNIVAYSKSMISILESEGVTKGKASLIPCGINTKKFGEHSNIYTGPPLNIICIARLHPIKGHDIIIKAAKILIDEGLEIRIKLIGDGELRPQLEDLVNKLSIQHNISFLGACEQSVVVNNLLQSHVHILASHHEGLGIANLEAMAMGKAVIGTEVGGLAEVIENDSNGILIPPNNPTELANAIRRIYYSPDFWKKIAENARLFCADNYSIDRQTRKLIELFTS
jgi:glycosyltransferase involved in cell wall biosynthesis